ncbi:MAG TPA: hypothetical protein VHX42_02635 [Candidatus Babeliales bacterium]|jgi:hypothetical protein|nr:hypothetical protein [Candidatus Babeliales bacterium]
MKKQIIFLVIFGIQFFTTHHCTAMENEEVLIFQPIDNGLLTRITAKVIQTDIPVHNYSKYKTYNSYEIVTTNTLTTLIQGTTSKEYSKEIYRDAYEGYKSNASFCPLIIEYASKFTSFTNHGKFDRKKHTTAKEAMRFSKAVYFRDLDQGVIVYSLDQQPDPTQWTEDQMEEFLAALKELTISQ